MYSAGMTNYSKGNRAVAPPDRGSTEIIREYKTKQKILTKIAPEVVGGASDVGSFEVSFGRFYKGGVIPLVAGWFGEINRDFEQTIVALAKEMAASDFGRPLSPLMITEKKGGAFLIMLYNSSEEQLEFKL